ncbi:MAG: H-type lectin domain-containing protein [Magnetococcus sp. YQC-5]
MFKKHKGLVVLLACMVGVFVGRGEIVRLSAPFLSEWNWDLRSWVLGEGMSRLEERVARLEETQQKTEQARLEETQKRAEQMHLEELQNKLVQDQNNSLLELRSKLLSLEGQITERNPIAERLAALEAQGRMMRMDSGALSAKQDDKEWRLTNIFARTREFRQRVEFAKPFSEVPRVVMGIVLMDFQEKIRFQASPEAIDLRGFTVLFETRAEERPKEVRVEWLAYGL